jgi:Predicted esterase
MALIKMEFFSTTMGMDTEVYVIMPEISGEFSDKKEIPVLYCLHGGAANYSDVLRNSCIERYARQKGIAVVLPSAGMSRWFNAQRGEKVEDYVVFELPQRLKTVFPKLSADRSKKYIAGFSMGGSGALTLAMLYPEEYSQALIISTSSVVPLEHLRLTNQKPWTPEGCMDTNELTFGASDSSIMKGSRYDVLAQSIRNIEDGKQLPELKLAVGTEDHGFEVCLALRSHFLGIPGNPYHFKFYSEVACHSWDFADKWFGKFIEMI